MKTVKVDYHCWRCETDRQTAVKDEGDYFCPLCLGMLYVLIDDLAEDVQTRKLVPSGRQSWRPVGSVRTVKMAGRNRICVGEESGNG